MKTFEEIDAILMKIGTAEYACATLTDGSKILFYIPDSYDNSFSSRFMFSCCAQSTDEVEDKCDNFSHSFLMLHPEDIANIVAIDYCQIEKLLTAPDSSFDIMDDDFDFCNFEDYLMDFFSEGGTVAFYSNPFESFDQQRNIPNPPVVVATKEAPVTKDVTTQSIVIGRKRKLFV